MIMKIPLSMSVDDDDVKFLNSLGKPNRKVVLDKVCSYLHHLIHKGTVLDIIDQERNEKVFEISLLKKTVKQREKELSLIDKRKLELKEKLKSKKKEGTWVAIHSSDLETLKKNSPLRVTMKNKKQSSGLFKGTKGNKFKLMVGNKTVELNRENAMIRKIEKKEVM